MENPARDLPRAMYLSIGIVMVLYVWLAAAIVGAVEPEELTSSGVTLLAVAAISHFGEVGSTLLLVSAILSTVTCLNGGLFGVTSITFTLAEHGQLPSRARSLDPVHAQDVARLVLDLPLVPRHRFHVGRPVAALSREANPGPGVREGSVMPGGAPRARRPKIDGQRTLAVIIDAEVADMARPQLSEASEAAPVKRGLGDACARLCELEWNTLLLAHGLPLFESARAELRTCAEG